MNYYETIPIGKNNPILRNQLCILWNMCDRQVRNKVAKLRSQDNGDDFVIVSTSDNAGYYRSDDRLDINKFKQQTLKRGKKTFLPLKKVNRILGTHENQSSISNALRIARIESNLKGSEVIQELRKLDKRFDKSLLSKLENGLCLPTSSQAEALSKLYNKPISDLIGIYITQG